MVGRVAGKPLPAELTDQIVTRTDGVPLFVEELTKSVLESGLLREEDDRFALVGPLPPLAIPTSLQDSLMARLDRYSTVKEVAQTGAAIGRQFSYALVAAASPLPASEVAHGLSRGSVLHSGGGTRDLPQGVRPRSWHRIVKHPGIMVQCRRRAPANSR
jgi:predicted ATPase